MITTTAFAPSEIVDPKYYQEHGYPHQAWTELRRRAPLARCEAEGFLPFWAVTKHQDIVGISKDPERFLNAPLIAIFHRESVNPEEERLRHLLNMDNPDHRRYRKLTAAYFTPLAVAPRLRNYESLADEILDRLVGKEEIDFVTEVSALLPIWIIADMLGIPKELREQFFQWTNKIIGAGDPEFRDPDASPIETSRAAIDAQIAYFNHMVEERRRKPTEDITSILANAKLDGQPLPLYELFSYLVLLVVAGNETTRNAASGGLLALIENPGELEKLRRNPGLLDSAVEEIVRWVTPVIQFCRTPRVDVEVRGQEIQAGEHLCLFYPSANRDEDVFEDPFAFRVDRHPNRHLAFGIGEHVCLGANLARTELKAIFGRLLARLESIELAGPVERLRSSFVGGIKHMPVRLELRA